MRLSEIYETEGYIASNQQRYLFLAFGIKFWTWKHKVREYLRLQISSKNWHSLAFLKKSFLPPRLKASFLVLQILVPTKPLKMTSR